MSNSPPDSPTTKETCPVNHKTRNAWIAATSSSSNPPSPSSNPQSQTQTESCSSTNSPTTYYPTHPLRFKVPSHLSTDREISSIPRTTPDPSTPTNPESTHARTSSSGHWIYPSEAMFFAAMKRKNWDPNAKDMRTVVPIHNAVNERAWKEIKDWEAGRGSEKCGGPKLVSFSGDSSKLTPKARLRCLLGYTAPFDRHDWVVDRCGRQIEYVIDFYSGKKDPKRPEAISFYLDVRPKINSVEGVWMRINKAFSDLFA